jgi:large subunit ribosomal protein L30
MADTIKVKLVKSTIGALPKHKKTIEALGLRKIRQVVEKQDNPQMRGMIQQVSHLVKIVEE